MKDEKVGKFWDKMSLTSCKWSSLSLPATEIPVLFTLGQFHFPFSAPALCSNERLDLPVWETKKWENFGTKWNEHSVNGPVWMAQVLKSLCLVHFGTVPFPIFSPCSLQLWKIGPPSMKEKKVGKCWDKMSLAGCKWSSLSAPGTEIPFFVHFGTIPIPNSAPALCSNERLELPVWKRKRW